MTIPGYLHCLILPTPFPVGPVNTILLGLDLLEAEGRVQAQMHDGRVKWLRR
jgi:hypothetical protein